MVICEPIGRYFVAGKERTIYGTLAAPLFPSAEIVEALEIDEAYLTSQIAVSDRVKLNTDGSWFVDEAGLYGVLARSTAPDADLVRNAVKIALRELRKGFLEPRETKFETPTDGVFVEVESETTFVCSASATDWRDLRTASVKPAFFRDAPKTRFPAAKRRDVDVVVDKIITICREYPDNTVARNNLRHRLCTTPLDDFNAALEKLVAVSRVQIFQKLTSEQSTRPKEFLKFLF